jgi:hypothetical protein
MYVVQNLIAKKIKINNGISKEGLMASFLSRLPFSANQLTNNKYFEIFVNKNL